jgi:uncharacterized protein (TIGR00255 family)
MTGHGQARRDFGEVSVWAEVRSVNNRFLKVTISSTDRQADLEAKVRQSIQRTIRRGSVHVNLEIRRDSPVESLRVNTGLLRKLHHEVLSVDPNASAASLLAVPGVVESALPERPDAALLWAQVGPVLDEALVELESMRRQEGQAMAADLDENCRLILKQLEGIRHRAPAVAEAWCQRLAERLNGLLAEHEVAVSPSDLIREVGIFAERCDISEEIVRLATHVDQFLDLVKSGQGDGRKLEFLSQEMLRETNTIGSKANDGDNARAVVEIKTAIERIREMTQNIE